MLQISECMLAEERRQPARHCCLQAQQPLKYISRYGGKRQLILLKLLDLDGYFTLLNFMNWIFGIWRQIASGNS